MNKEERSTTTFRVNTPYRSETQLNIISSDAALEKLSDEYYQLRPSECESISIAYSKDHRDYIAVAKTLSGNKIIIDTYEGVYMWRIRLATRIMEAAEHWKQYYSGDDYELFLSGISTAIEYILKFSIEEFDTFFNGYMIDIENGLTKPSPRATALIIAHNIVEEETE